MSTKTKSRKTSAKVAEKSVLRRSALAYLGLHGLAYDRFQLRREQARELTTGLFDVLAEKGEVTLKQSEVLFKKAESTVLKSYSETAEKVTEILPVPVKSKVERLEDELAELEAKFKRMSKTAKPKAKAKPAKKTAAEKQPVAKKAVPAKKVVTAKNETPKQAVKPKAVDQAQTEMKLNVTVEEKAETTTAKQSATPTPRHIPYFNDVKRYDPLANEDIVRKIVNHCGIALRSEDARYVACSDESERATVRDSWLKKKLGLSAEDRDLDKRVMEVCSLMQRDQKKNRVTFYYLLAKKERKLDTL